MQICVNLIKQKTEENIFLTKLKTVTLSLNSQILVMPVVTWKAFISLVTYYKTFYLFKVTIIMNFLYRGVRLTF